MSDIVAIFLKILKFFYRFLCKPLIQKFTEMLWEPRRCVRTDRRANVRDEDNRRFWRSCESLEITFRDVHKPCVESVVTFIINKTIKRGGLCLLLPS